MSANDVPVLRQSVRWGEEYVSRGLNIKLAGIIRPGVYHGFVLKPGGIMTVLVEHAPDYPRSVAVVERDGFSLTVVMDDPGVVTIPTKGAWYVCIEALYAPTQQGYQRIVARERPESHHIVLGKVYAGVLVPPDGETSPEEGPVVVITEEMITTEGREEAGANDTNVEQALALAEQAAFGLNALIGTQADTIANMLRLSTRLTSHAIARAGTGTTVIVNHGSGGGSGTFVTSDGTVVGPTAVGTGPDAVRAGAALTLIVETSDR